MGREILRFAQDDRAVLPAALWPTQAHVRLRVMPIRADKSATPLPGADEGRRDKSAPTADRMNLLKFIIGDVHDKSVTCPPDRVPTVSQE